MCEPPNSKASSLTTGSITLHPRAVTVELSGLRRAVAEFVRSHDGDADLVDDLQLVVSELAANVIEHAAADRFRVCVVRTIERWTVEVSVAEGVPDVSALMMPALGQRTGRGLPVVAALVDDIEVIDVDGAAVLRCSIAA